MHKVRTGFTDLKGENHLHHFEEVKKKTVMNVFFYAMYIFMYIKEKKRQ